MADPVIPKWMRPLWVRILLCAVPAACAIAEFIYGETLWALLFGSSAAFGTWTYLINYKAPEE